MTAPRAIPSIDELVRSVEQDYPGVPRPLLVGEARRVAADIRASRGEGTAEERLRRSVDTLLRPSLVRVINATGVVLHTNLGRAPLAASTGVAGYSNLEYDLATGRRGKRDTHVGRLLERLAGAPAIVVNNNAAATFLMLNELAAGAEVIVSRGELIEIGDGFRIPDIMSRSGAVLREVGTTNRTRVEDYAEAINDRTRLLMRVHPSNFTISGFTSKPSLSELAALARERGLPLYEDLGSGCVVDLRAHGVAEPLVADSLRAGVNVVSFSGDKLLGGPQAGIIAGDAELVARLRRNPMFRALRVDKLITRALEDTLRALLLEDWSRVPALGMIALTAEEIRQRAEALAARIDGATVVEGRSVIGGGSTPEQSLPTWLVRVPGVHDARLRRGEPPIIARVEDGATLIDLRTVFPDDDEAIARALA